MKTSDWQEDYDPDSGMSGICPKCGSDDVGYGLGPVYPSGQWECYDCEFTEVTA